jgi:hypothetical protein
MREISEQRRGFVYKSGVKGVGGYVFTGIKENEKPDDEIENEYDEKEKMRRLPISLNDVSRAKGMIGKIRGMVVQNRTGNENCQKGDRKDKKYFVGVRFHLTANYDYRFVCISKPLRRPDYFNCWRKLSVTRKQR